MAHYHSMLKSAASKIQREEGKCGTAQKEIDSEKYANHTKLGNLDSLSSPVTKESWAKNEGDETSAHASPNQEYWPPKAQ